ncbi:hypothetical protein [Bacillus mojavensis]|uniref:hypothetical protein n=1 Tax=Bacillus mojavensis TaxID=72360 RepID=UPI003990BB24
MAKDKGLLVSSTVIPWEEKPYCFIIGSSLLLTNVSTEKMVGLNGQSDAATMTECLGKLVRR